MSVLRYAQQYNAYLEEVLALQDAVTAWQAVMEVSVSRRYFSIKRKCSLPPSPEHAETVISKKHVPACFASLYISHDMRPTA